MPLSRREFAQRALAAAAFLTGADVRAVGAFRLNYILASSLYGQLPLREILPEVAGTGASAIDLWPKKHGSQREELDAMGEEAFMALLAEHQVKPGIFTRYDLGAFKLDDEVRLAGRLGVKLVVAMSGGAGDEAIDLKDRIRAFVERMRPTADLAASLGVTVAIENHSNSLVNTHDAIRYFVEFAPPAGIGLALAPYHLPQDPDLIAGLIRDIGPRIVHFYAWEHGHGSHEAMPKVLEMQQLPGYGDLDFTPILQALKDVGYAGWTSIFMHPFPRGIPILPTIPECTAAINRSREYLDHRLAALA